MISVTAVRSASELKMTCTTIHGPPFGPWTMAFQKLALTVALVPLGLTSVTDIPHEGHRPGADVHNGDDRTIQAPASILHR